MLLSAGSAAQPAQPGYNVPSGMELSKVGVVRSSACLPEPLLSMQEDMNSINLGQVSCPSRYANFVHFPTTHGTCSANNVMPLPSSRIRGKNFPWDRSFVAFSPCSCRRSRLSFLFPTPSQFTHRGNASASFAGCPERRKRSTGLLFFHLAYGGAEAMA